MSITSSFKIVITKQSLTKFDIFCWFFFQLFNNSANAFIYFRHLVKKDNNAKMLWDLYIICDLDCDHLYYTVELYQLVRNTLQQQALKIKKRQKDFERLLKRREKYQVCTFGSIPFIAIFLSDRSWWIVSAGDITY